jgi:hypothetical protein
MLVRIITESLDAGSSNITFRVDTDAKSFDCGISRDALLDLAGYHRLSGPDEAMFRDLWPVIERLIAEKRRAVRAAPGAEILITCTDILLYGFEGFWEPALTSPDISSAQTAT